MTQDEWNLNICGTASGRALLVAQDGALYCGRGYRIYRSHDGGREWVLDCQIRAQGWKPLVSKMKLAARLLRYNIQALRVLPDGSRVAIARNGAYRAQAGDLEMNRKWTLVRGSRPINLSADGDRLLFGEYGGPEMDAVGVRIYCSGDCGEHFEPVYEFPKGDIRHVHNVVFDEYEDHYWVLTGDYDRTPGIAALSKDFRHLDWLDRGNQMVRAVSVLVRPDCLIYGSDTELEANYIIRLEKRSGRYERIAPIDGSSIYSADFGNLALISTCVEPSKVNTSDCASVYGSRDGIKWSKLLSQRKDGFSPTLFQFGLVVLPVVQTQVPCWGMLSGQAVAENHNRVGIFTP